jgi:hypothetical protein
MAGHGKDVIQQIEAEQPLCVDLEKPALGGDKVGPGFPGQGHFDPGTGKHAGQPFGGLVLVDVIWRKVEDLDVGFSDGPKDRQISFAKNSPAPQDSALLPAGSNAGQVVGQGQTCALLYGYLTNVH